MFLRNGRIGIFDLSAKEFVEEELPEELTLDSVSSLRTSKNLLAKHGSDSIVLGTGILTGSLIPASCAGTVVAGEKMMPLLGHAGIELKLSGFDFLVVNGKTSSSGYLWIRDGIAEFVDFPDSHAFDSWQRTDKIRSDQGDSKIQALSGGSWCDAGNPAAQLVIDYWGGEDKAGVGAEFGKKNLTAIAFRGMGELEIANPDAHYEESVSLMKSHLSSLGPNRGLQSYFGGAVREDFASLVHRSMGCFGCPFPCRTFLKTEEDPKEMHLVHKEPGYLHYDISALATSFELDLSLRNTTTALIRCARAGTEPVSALTACAAGGGKVDLASLDRLLANPSRIEPSRKGNFESSFSERKDYETCLGLGLCPRYWAKAGFDLEAMSPSIESAIGAPMPSGE